MTDLIKDRINYLGKQGTIPRENYLKNVNYLTCEQVEDEYVTIFESELLLTSFV